MHKVKKIFLGTMMLCSLFPLSANKVQAQRVGENLYPMSCNAFEVDRVGADSSGKIYFEKVSCTSDWNTAKKTMYDLGNAGVIRHASSWSPSKIINMSSGVVYTYPQRDNSNVAYVEQIYDLYGGQGVPFGTKKMGITFHREMFFNGLWTIPVDGHAKVRVNASGFDGFVDLKDVDLVPMSVIQNGQAMYLGGNDSERYKEDPFFIYPAQQYYRVEKNGNYMDLVLHYFSGWADASQKPRAWVSAVGPAADWMHEGDVYYSYDNYTFYADRACQSQVGIYYPYYQFVFLRSRTGIKEETFNRFLTVKGKNDKSKLWNTGAVWLNAQATYGVNAAEIFAMACLESGYGMSAFARERNNLFGWNAVDSDPNQASYFKTVEQAIYEHMGINLRGYLDIHDGRYFGSHLGNKESGFNVKYATDNYWGVKIASIAYELDKCDNQYNGHLTDFNHVSLGIVKDDQMTVIRKTPNGATLYETKYGVRYQKNHTLAILSEAGDWYQVQSTNLLDGSGNAMTYKGVGLQAYAWDRNVGWIRKDQVTRINGTAIITDGRKATGDPVRTLTELTWNQNGMLHMAGKNYVPGVYADSENKAEQKIYVQNMQFVDAAEQNLSLTVQSLDQISWQTDLDVTKLEKGKYFFRMASTYAITKEYDAVYLLGVMEKLPEAGIYKGRVYRLDKEQVGDTDVLTLSVTDLDCGNGSRYDAQSDSCLCLEGYQNWKQGEGCSLIPEPEENISLWKSLETTAYDADGKKILLQGMAFLKGMDAGNDVQMEVILRGMESGAEVKVPTTVNDAQTPLELYDGHTYSRIMYQAAIDPSILAKDIYMIRIQVKNGDVQKEDSLFSIQDTIDLPEIDSGGNVVRLFANPMYSYRMELAVEVPSVDRSLIHKPLRSASVYGANQVQVKSGILSIDGYGLIRNTPIAAGDHPVYSVLLVNQKGEVQRQEAVNKACSVDFSKLLGLDYSLERACFDVSIDLHQLDEGSYTLFLDLKTDTARDIYEMYDIRDMKEVKETDHGRVYTLAKANAHDRYVLTIQKEVSE